MHAPPELVDALAAQLVDLPSNREASPSPRGEQVAYVSDRSGHPQVWVAVTDPLRTDPPRRVVLPGEDPVTTVHWSPSGDWLAVAVAAGGGVPTSVWVVRPDGTDARLVADAAVCGNAVLGPWSRSTGQLLVTLAAPGPDEDQPTIAVDPLTGAVAHVAEGDLAVVLDVSDDERFLLVRDGPRGQRWCVVVDRDQDRDHAVQPFGRGFADAFPVTSHPQWSGAAAGGGSTDTGVLRPHPAGDGIVAYVRSDVGRQHPALLAVPLSRDGERGEGGVIASRPDSDLELFAVDTEGLRVALVWNVGGWSQLEIMDLLTYQTRRVDSFDGTVVTSVAFADDAPVLAVTAERADRAPRTWLVDAVTTAARSLFRVEPAGASTPVGYGAPTVNPRPVYFDAVDGLPLAGWLYEPHGRATTGPALVYLHGGPEAEERPTFSPLFQTLVAAGITVFTPNVRGSSGSGRTFGHADDRGGRYAAISDVVAAAEELIRIGVAAPSSLLIGGRSYGGYLTLAAMTRFPDLFAGGVAECGMSDLLTFYATTEPWIAAAAVSKYGDPVLHRGLLEDLSPLKDVAALGAPLLLVHGDLDTNVPYTESTQFLDAALAAGKDVELVTLEGEGHEFRARPARLAAVEAWLRFCQRVLRSAPAEPADQP
ncbi:S9 family peptidase [Jatrophihabitans sp. YIM 134969]